MKSISRSYRVLLEQDEDGKFTATVPELPGCLSCGNTRVEALKNVKEAKPTLKAYKNTMSQFLPRYMRRLSRLN